MIRDDFPLFEILRNDNRFAYDIPLKTVFLPDIYALARVFGEEDEDLTAFNSGSIEWVILGINHEYLHFILHQLIGSETSIRMDFLKGKEFL